MNTLRRLHTRRATISRIDLPERIALLSLVWNDVVKRRKSNRRGHGREHRDRARQAVLEYLLSPVQRVVGEAAIER